MSAYTAGHPPTSSAAIRSKAATNSVTNLALPAMLFAHVFVLGYVAVLGGGIGVQAVEGDMPCPLCVLQRMAMMLCALGPAYIIQRCRTGEVTAQDFAMGYGLAIVAGVAGMAMAGRQVLLHIVPPDEGYGEPILGLHLYTWAFITFTVAIVTAGINLMLAHRIVPTTAQVGHLSTITLWVFVAIVAVNVLIIFAEEGFNWTLPDNPVRYELLYQLNLR